MALNISDSDKKSEGQRDGVQPAPDVTGTFDGAGAHPEVDGCTSQDLTANLRFQQPWQTGNTSTSGKASFVLGDVPD